MSRDGSNIYHPPFPDVAAGTTIASAVYNGFVNDVAIDLNTPRPIVAGGTGASTAAAAIAALSGEVAKQIVVNYDSFVFVPGSFYSATTATGEPVDGHSFSGIVYMSDANNIVLEARDEADGKLYVRRKVAGVWGTWALDGDLSGVNASIALKVAKAGDTMTGQLTLNADPGGPLVAATKQYADAIATAAATATGLKVAKGGDTMTGLLVLSADPGTALGAATKQYADAAGNNRVRFDAAQGLSTTQMAQARTNIAAVLRGHLWGLTLSAAGGLNIFGIAAGDAADSTNVDLMVLASAYTKNTASWAVGTGNGALDTGAIANNWYYVFVIKRPDTGVVDILISLSPTAPTLPTNYTLSRRIGAIKLESSLWRKFRQIGDDFLWATPVLDINNVNPNVAGASYSVSVPPSITIKADINFAYDNTGAGQFALYVDSPLTDIASPGVSSAYCLVSQGAGLIVAQRLGVWTANGQFHAQSNAVANDNFYATTFGWTDPRGRLQ